LKLRCEGKLAQGKKVKKSRDAASLIFIFLQILLQHEGPLVAGQANCIHHITIERL
jgi:hypothetical protein